MRAESYGLASDSATRGTRPGTSLRGLGECPHVTGAAPHPTTIPFDARRGPANMTVRPYILAETTWKTVREMAYDVAVLPWGATEAHNYHLPYGTDNVESDYIAAEAARLAWDAGARVVVLPIVPFGVQTGQLDIPFCLNLTRGLLRGSGRSRGRARDQHHAAHRARTGAPAVRGR